MLALKISVLSAKLLVPAQPSFTKPPLLVKSTEQHVSVRVCRAKAGMSAAAEGKLASTGNNPFSAANTAGGTAPTPQSTSQGAVDEGDIEAEGGESALISLERVTAVLTLNAQQGVSPGMKVSHVAPISHLNVSVQTRLSANTAGPVSTVQPSQ